MVGAIALAAYWAGRRQGGAPAPEGSAVELVPEDASVRRTDLAVSPLSAASAGAPDGAMGDAGAVAKAGAGGLPRRDGAPVGPAAAGVAKESSSPSGIDQGGALPDEAIGLSAWRARLGPDAVEVRGHFLHEGPAPVMVQPEGDAPRGCPGGERPLVRNGQVPSVIVWVTAPPPGPYPVRVRTQRVALKGCAFHPWVVALQRGAWLQLENQDDLLHNVHGTGRPEFMFALPGAERRRRWQTRRAGAVASLTCVAHSAGASGYYRVFEHPYFAVSDEHGEFSLPPLPPGAYAVHFYHPVFEVAPQEIRLVAGVPHPVLSISVALSAERAGAATLRWPDEGATPARSP